MNKESKNLEKKKFLGSLLDAPNFLKVEHILSGYRINYEVLDCWYSALAIHNETGITVFLM
jgi:hypothetical protein